MEHKIKGEFVNNLKLAGKGSARREKGTASPPVKARKTAAETDQPGRMGTDDKQRLLATVEKLCLHVPPGHEAGSQQAGGNGGAQIDLFALGERGGKTTGRNVICNHFVA